MKSCAAFLVILASAGEATEQIGLLQFQRRGQFAVADSADGMFIHSEAQQFGSFDYKPPSELTAWAQHRGDLRPSPGTDEPLNLAGPPAGFHSQYPDSTYQQDKYVDLLLKHKTDGFVVEAGANNGESLSNSLFFEVSRNWTGLLVEPSPIEYQQLVNRKRKMWTLRGGLSPTKEISTFEFVSAGFVGGIKDQLGTRELQEISKEQLEQTVTVTCYPLHTLLQGMGVGTVDYWSLDTEGSEPGILEATDFNAIEVGVLGVEHNGVNTKQDRIKARMDAVGFLRKESTFQDDIYVNPAYFKRLDLPLDM